MNFRITISALGARLRSPRTLLAIVVSVVATAGVGGPLAFEAYHARDLISAQQAAAETRDDADSLANGGDSDGTNDGGTDDGSDEVADGSTTTTPGDDGTGGGDGTDGSGATATTAPRGATGTVVTPTTVRGGRATTTTAPGANGSGATTVPPGAVTTTVPANDLLILVSVSPLLVPASPLAGKQLTGEVYVFIDASTLDPLLGDTVQWQLDGAPIELVRGRLDVRNIPTGPHTLVATVTLPVASLAGSAPFTVAR